MELLLIKGLCWTEFWARRYYMPTSGREDEEVVRRYMGV